MSTSSVTTASTAGQQLAGAFSGFNFQTFIDETIAADSYPITTLQAQETANNNVKSDLVTLGTELTTLQASVSALNSPDLFGGRTAASTTSGSTWTAAATTNTGIGSYTIAVSHIATDASLQGASGIGQKLNSTSDVSGLTLSSLSTAVPLTAGVFTVNGQQVTIALTDTLKQAFDKISTATTAAGNTVTATYDPVADKINLSASGTITLGAANDTSNFLTTMKLGNSGTNNVTSAGTLGVTNITAPLINAHLKAAIGGVDGSGNGSFTVNGVSISYNVNTDTLSSVMGKINSSTAGVTASYDALNDRMILTNGITGDIGLNVAESSNSLLYSMGLTTGATAVSGSNAQFTVNGGTTLYSHSNVLNSTVTGISGLTVTVNTPTTETIKIGANTDAMQTAIQSFLTNYNNIQLFIDGETAISTDSTGKPTTSLLSNNREVQSWSDQMRSLCFAAVPGLAGTISSLDNMGIGFSSISSQISIQNQSKLTAALTNTPGDVESFFTNINTGFVAKFNKFFNSTIGPNGDLSTQETTLANSNTSIDAQIAALQTKLTQERATLTAAFTAMEDAQQTSQSQATALTKAFG